MRIRVTFDVAGDQRKALAWSGNADPATHAHIKSWIELAIKANLDSLVSDWQNDDYAQELEAEKLIRAGVLEPNYGPNDQRRHEG